MIDYNLMQRLVDYRKYKGFCFKNYIISLYEDKDLDRKLNSRYQRISRMRKRLFYLVSRYKYLYFCTFTFDDYYISLCERSQKDLIKKSLLQFDPNIKMILNVDYGKKTERLHYHCICATNCNCDLSIFLKFVYPCFSFVEKINFSTLDFTRVLKYVDKLSNHALKDSTKGRRVYFNFKGYEDPLFVKINGCTPSRSYLIEKTRIVTLLDKGDVTGKGTLR